MNTEHICNELCVLQRQRKMALKSKNMQHNQLRANVASEMGYNTSMTPKEREIAFKKADTKIKQIVDDDAEFSIASIVKISYTGIKAFNVLVNEREKAMRKLAKQLPVADWVSQPTQKGFGILSLAILIGECGDLTNYKSPGRIWRRMGLIPWTYNGETRMGSTWMKLGLPNAEWEAFGYNPTRRSIAFLFGENIVKCNGNGPYRRRYLYAKAKAYADHPEWKWNKCPKCGKRRRKNCTTCGGSGHTCKQAHRHGMLIASKYMIKYLWRQWHGQEGQDENELACAA